VTKVAADCEFVSDMVSSGHVQEVCIAQSDVKDMYTEISHAEIVACVAELLSCWRASKKPSMLNITTSGRKGVSPGPTSDRKVAATMQVDTIVQIVLYGLQHAFFHVGCKHIMQQALVSAWVAQAGLYWLGVYAWLMNTGSTGGSTCGTAVWVWI
jgi:hypothetical protein